MSTQHDIIVIGAGIAGLCAAREAARQGLKVCLFEQLMFGGLVLNVNHLAPGLASGPTSGADLAADLMSQLSDLGVHTVYDAASALEIGPTVRVECGEGAQHARALIVASGAQLRTLGIAGEAEFAGRGVSQCADCDGPMFSGKTVVVVGGGDSALQEALVLAQFCAQVHLVHRAASFSGRQKFIDEVTADARIVLHMSTQVEVLKGDETLQAVVLRGPDGQAREIASMGFFAYVGLEPCTSFLPARLARDAGGYLLVDANLQTSAANVGRLPKSIVTMPIERMCGE